MPRSARDGTGIVKPVKEVDLLAEAQPKDFLDQEVCSTVKIRMYMNDQGFTAYSFGCNPRGICKPIVCMDNFKIAAFSVCPPGRRTNGQDACPKAEH